MASIPSSCASFLLLASLAAPLAACGDDTSDPGAGGSSSDASVSTAASSSGDAGSGGEDAGGTGGSGGGGGATPDGERVVAACDAYCSSLQTVADELSCGVVDDEETPCNLRCFRDTYGFACPDEYVALLGCRADVSTSASCVCESEGDLECDDACPAAEDALAACEAPFRDACEDAEAALADACDEPAYLDRCRLDGDIAYRPGSDCFADFEGYIACVIADGGDSCVCDEDGFADCSDVCAQDLEDLILCNSEDPDPGP